MTFVIGVSISNQNKAYAFGLTTILLWSTVAVAFKLALAQLDIYQLVFYATLFATIILLFITWFNGSHVMLGDQFKRHWKITVVSGCINPVLYYIILFAAYDRLPAQVAQPINYTWAIVLTFFSIVFLKQSITRADCIAALVCYAGVVIIAMQGQFFSLDAIEILGSSTLEYDYRIGLFLAILSTFVWAGYWILNLLDQREPLIALCLNFLVALPVAGLVCLFCSTPVISTKEGLIGAIYIGFAEMSVAFLFWSKALKLAENTSRISNLVFFSPFISLVLIHIFLGETIHVTTYGGLSLIVFGLLYQQYSSVKISRPDTESVL